jgi:hypothetical protein
VVKTIKSKADAEKMLDDEFDDGALLQIQKQFSPGGYVYTYGAQKAHRAWYITGQEGSFSTTEFVAWLSRGRNAPAPRIFWAKTVYEI